MLRMSKLADYGIILMVRCASNSGQSTFTARDLVQFTQLPEATVGKVLKRLTREGLLISHRGVKGGYELARKPRDISLADIIVALEGPIAITQCSDDASNRDCNHEALCPVGQHWQIINQLISSALTNVSLAEMVAPASMLCDCKKA
ncbi:MAG: SUF system Fe-S cluster assembly regulator [Candidatus Omnitrophica bacterium]|nr:SUF system Fe-S cluster assembly regulator [Candidatus Omnitrophota bacterium]